MFQTIQFKNEKVQKKSTQIMIVKMKYGLRRVTEHSENEFLNQLLLFENEEKAELKIQTLWPQIYPCFRRKKHIFECSPLFYFRNALLTAITVRQIM